MMSKIQTDDSEGLIVDMEADVLTVRYNSLAYERKIERQVTEELRAQPITLRAVSPAPITQRAIPKR